MLSKFYSFGGFSVCVYGDAFTPSKFCEPFEIAECRPDHRISLRFSDDIPSPPAFADHGGAAYRWREGERFCIEFCHADGLRTFAVTEGGETSLTMSERYRGVVSSMTVLESAGLLDLLAQQGMLILHSSYIVTKDGKGILFSGESGVGKSTQAELWRSFAGAEVINGDRSLVCPASGMVHGIFYSGTSKICRNVSAPLRAIVLPRQSRSNEVYALRPQEIFMRLLNQCSYYPWAADSTAKMTELVALLTSTVPVVGLDCRIDEAAVTVLDEYLRRD